MDTTNNIFIIILAFLFGTMVGSFLNVVIYRVPKKMSIVTPPSHCFKCKKRIPFYHNIPIVGYFILNGKCGHCGYQFPSRYAFVELTTGILTIIIYLIFGMSFPSLIYLCLTYLLVAVTFVDIDHFIIPNGFIIFGLIVLTAAIAFDLLKMDWH